MTTRRGLAIGCGGLLGFAWTAVALDAVERAMNWDTRTAEVLLGSSAGAEIVAALGSGRTPADLLAALDADPDADPVLARHVAVDPGKLPPLPGLALPGLGLVGAGLRSGSAYTAVAGLLPRGRGDATWLRSYGGQLAGPHGWVEHPATWLIAADAATGRRVAFGAKDADASPSAGHPAASETTFGEVPLAGRPAASGTDAGEAGRPAASGIGSGAVPSAGHLAASETGSGAMPSNGRPARRENGARAAQARLGDAIAASWAIPGWFPPVRIGGRKYVDGGAVSSVSADLLVPLGLDEVVVIAPMTSAGGAPATGLNRVERLLRAQMTRGLDREIALLRAAGTRVIRVEPGPGELAAMGPNFMDSARRPATLAAAREYLPTRVAAAVRASRQREDTV